MRAPLAIALVLARNFGVCLIDEAFSVDGGAISEKAALALRERLSAATVVTAPHTLRQRAVFAKARRCSIKAA
jgi:ABC-type polysaccharide/polyol phosphate transport system ATPase subunit